METEIRKRNNSMMSNHSASSMKDDAIDLTNSLKQNKHPITRICLTGGPCAGKTTALATL